MPTASSGSRCRSGGLRPGGRDGDRRGRREHLPGAPGGRPRHGPGDRGLHGDAGHGAERAHPSGRAREAWCTHAGAVGDPGHGGGGALHPPPRHPPPREGADRDLRRGHREPVLHHRHRCRATGSGDPRGGHPDGQARRRGRLRRRSVGGPGRELPARDQPSPGDRAGAAGDGLDRADAVHGQRPADLRLQHGGRAQHRQDRPRGACGHPGVVGRRRGMGHRRGEGPEKQ